MSRPATPPKTAASRARHALERSLEVVTWVAAILSLLIFVGGLRDTPVLRTDPSTPAPTPAPNTPSARVCARVTDPSHSPLPGARLLAYVEREDRTFVPTGTAHADSAGTACLSQVAFGVVWFLAEAEGYARASTQVAVDGDRDLSLELAPATTLRVRVTDELNAPLARATVLITGSDPLPYGSLTGSDGSQHFNRLPPAPWTVRVMAAGYENAIRMAVTTAELSVSLRRLAALAVHVVDAHGAPAAGATVLIAGSSLWPARQAQTNESGVAAIRGLSQGSYDLRAQLNTDVSEPLLGFELARGAEQTITLHLQPGRMVTAWVTDGEAADAHSIESADVVLVEGGVGSFPLQGRTGSSGTVTLGPVSSGPATLAAHAADFVTGPLVSVPSVLAGPVRVPLLRGGVLRGEVVDARGFGVDGASIEVVGTDRFGLPIAQTPLAENFRAAHFAWTLGGPPGLIAAGELGVMPGPVPPIPRGSSGLDTSSGPLASGSWLSATDSAPWVSNAQGEFTASPITPGKVRALVRHPEFVEGASELVTITPGGESRVRVVLLRGGGLEGRVLDDRGFPLASVQVQIVADRGTFERSTITATDGAFAFAAVPEEITVTVSRPLNLARVALKKKLRIPEGGRERVELTLSAPREPVRLLVLDEGENPVELAEVRVVSLDPVQPLRSTLFTDAQGAAELADALGLPLRMVVDAPGHSLLTHSIDAAPKEIRLKLDPGVIVSGTVTSVRGRRAVAGALVTLRFGSDRKSTMTDADGHYRFSNVPPKRVEVAVSHPDFASASSSATVQRTTRADRPFELAPIDLSEAGTIEGEVLDSHGQPVSGARVSVGLAPAYLPMGALPQGVVLTDSTGHFSLTGVRPGKLSLGAHAPSVGRGSVDEVTVDEGRTTRGVTIRLKETSADEDLTANSGVAVTLAARGGGSPEIVVALVAGGSEAERGGLVAGDVLLRIDGEIPSSLADARARLSGREGSDVVLDLSRAKVDLRITVRRELLRH